jgi:hypothetical protein
MKSKSILFFLAISLYFSCSKDNDTDPGVVPTGDIQSSLFVTVKDPAGTSVAGAEIRIGNLTGITEEDGTYFFTKVTLSGDDYLRVEKTGYFKGSRRFFTKDSPTQFLHITLLPQAEIGSFSITHSATLFIDSKSKLIFPSQAVTHLDGSPYSGQVHVIASPIYGDDPQLSDKMPGALLGRNVADGEVALGSFGMLAVELQGDNGEVLQIAPGKTATVQFAVSDNQLGNAPSSIPLWYFDEDKGHWVEEGQAELQGSVYIAQLSHFSFWNWDVPLELVNWEVSFVYTDGRPAQNVQICLSVENISDQRCAYTDAKGSMYGLVPANKLMTMSAVNECGSNILSEEIGPFNSDIRLDAMTLNMTQQDYAVMTGTALQCDGLPIKSGFVKVHTPLNHFIFPITGPDGYFEGGYRYCVGDVVTLYVYDLTNSLVSFPQSVTFERNLNVGSITACNELTEFIRYKVKGFSPEYVYYAPELTRHSGLTTKVHSLDSIGFRGRFGFVFEGVSPGQFSATGAVGNQINLPNGQVAYITSMLVNVTEFGPEGEFVRGDFNGRITVGGNGAGGPGPSDFNGSFAVKND